MSGCVSQNAFQGTEEGRKEGWEERRKEGSRIQEGKTGGREGRKGGQEEERSRQREPRPAVLAGGGMRIWMRLSSGSRPLPLSHYRKPPAKMRNDCRRGWILGLIVSNQCTGAGMQGILGCR